MYINFEMFIFSLHFQKIPNNMHIVIIILYIFIKNKYKKSGENAVNVLFFKMSGLLSFLSAQRIESVKMFLINHLCLSLFAWHVKS